MLMSFFSAASIITICCEISHLAEQVEILRPSLTNSIFDCQLQEYAQLLSGHQPPPVCIGIQQSLWEKYPLVRSVVGSYIE